MGWSIYGVEVPWLQSLHKCTALALRSRAGIGESETSTQPRVLSPHKTHKSPTNARAAKITIAKSSTRYIKHTVIAVMSVRGTRPRAACCRYHGLATVMGDQASASPGIDRVRIRKVAAIQARTLAVGQTRKVLRC
jgi:hypothetical protein